MNKDQAVIDYNATDSYASYPEQADIWRRLSACEYSCLIK